MKGSYQTIILPTRCDCRRALEWFGRVELVRFENGPDNGTELLGGSVQIGMISTPSQINAADDRGD